jgi:hypothetical protein
MRAFVLSLAVVASCASPAPAPAPAEPSSTTDTRITLALNRASFRDAVDMIAKLSNLNVILDNTKDLSGTVTMSVTDVPAGEVLEAVAKTFGFKVVRVPKYNIVRITS